MEQQKDEFRHIYEALDLIRKKLPNGELHAIRDSVVKIQEDIEALREEQSNLSARLLDPETGIVVRLNELSRESAVVRPQIVVVPSIDNRLAAMEKWRDGANRAIWFIYTTVGGALLTYLVASIVK